MLNEAAILTAVAKTIATRLGREVGDRAWKDIERRTGRTPLDKALRDALRRAFNAFERLHPEWVDSFFDQHFLEHRAAPLLAKSVEPELFPVAEELARAWHEQFGELGSPTQDLHAVCRTFLRLFRRELRSRDAFRPAFDSFTIDQTYEEIQRLKAAVDVLAMRRAGEDLLSDSIVSGFADLGRTVERLTDEQCRIIDVLKHHRWALVSGTAGSGKTVVAMEKAIRLSRSTSTLFLCHNPWLADHVRDKTQGHRIEVKSFEQLVRELAGGQTGADPDWTAYSGPLSNDLERAFEEALAHEPRFGAVIVDEGQDFADDWWVLVEALLRPDQSDFYIFYDDQQSLLNKQATYPISGPPFDLSRNCRNGGTIYELMCAFVDVAPAPEEELVSLGRALCVASEGELTPAVQECCDWMSREGILTQACVVLGGGTPFETSVLANLEFVPTLRLDWVKALRSELRRAFNTRPRHADPRWTEVEPRLEGLGTHGGHPTDADVRCVSQAMRHAFLSDRGPSRMTPVWDVVGEGDAAELRLRSRHSINHVHGYFEGGQWAQDIRQLLPRPVRFVHHQAPEPDAIPVYAVGEYKGLEHEHVLVVMQGDAPELINELYVGISRARASLAIALDGIALRALTPRQRRKLGIG